MPTREVKKVSSTAWHVYLTGNTTNMSRKKQKLSTACSEFPCKDGTSITYRDIQRGIVELRWQTAIKYDNVWRFITTKAEIRENFTVVLPKVTPEAGSVEEVVSSGDFASTPGEAADTSVACANIGSIDGISTCSASSSELAGEQNESARSDSVQIASTLPLSCMPLKLSLVLNASDAEKSTIGFTVNWKRMLGEGTFAQVYEGLQNGTKAPLAIKAFKADKWQARCNAMQEVSAMSAFQPHPHLPNLLDVGYINGKICLATPRYDKNLHEVIKMRALLEVELTDILRCICDGLAHLHGAGLCHLDLKPQNILLRMGASPPVDKGPTPEFARWLLNLRDSLAVCVSDLGSAVLSDPTQRPILSQKQVTDHGVNVVTLWYRAPELIFGNAAYNFSADMWSLGCVVAEMVRRTPLFEGQNEVDTGIRIFRMFGKPSMEFSRRISGLQNPLLHGALPSCAAQPWPPSWLEDCAPQLIDFLEHVLKVDPSCRLSAGNALLHRLFRPQQMVTVMPAVSAGRGLASMQQAMLEPHLLAWLQEDPLWPELSEYIKNRLKHEESGYVRAIAPETKRINKQKAISPCRSLRLVRFMQEFLSCVRNWLLRLTMLVRKELQECPSTFIGCNGKDFLTHCFSDTAFAYSTIQVMKSGQREEEKHYDGGASLLHMAITIFGSRSLKCWHEDGSIQTFQQRPGSIYVGNMCAVEHQVAHLDDVSDLHCSSADHEDVKIAVMIRSDACLILR